MANISDLMNETAKSMGAVPLAPRADAVNCAETDGETFFYNPSFIAALESSAGEDGVRFVVAHEMGHQLGGMHNGGHAGEFMADEYAARTLARMGADFNAISSVFSFLNSPGSDSHPASSARTSAAHQAFRHERVQAVANDDLDLATPRARNLAARDRDLAI